MSFDSDSTVKAGLGGISEGPFNWEKKKTKI